MPNALAFGVMASLLWEIFCGPCLSVRAMHFSPLSGICFVAQNTTYVEMIYN